MRTLRWHLYRLQIEKILEGTTVSEGDGWKGEFVSTDGRLGSNGAGLSDRSESVGNPQDLRSHTPNRVGGLKRSYCASKHCSRWLTCTLFRRRTTKKDTFIAWDVIFVFRSITTWTETFQYFFKVFGNEEITERWSFRKGMFVWNCGNTATFRQIYPDKPSAQQSHKHLNYTTSWIYK